MKALQRGGFVVERQSGSHVVVFHAARAVRVTVPVHGSRDVNPGTLRGILSDAGLSREGFLRLLRRA